MATRWAQERDEQDSRDYVARFAEADRAGEDLHGEARFVDALAPRGARVLDAGAGTGRVGAELVRRGHWVTAVDLDPVLLDAARQHPGLDVVRADLAALDLGVVFDVVVAAGNVLVFAEPGSERTVLARLAAHLVPGGALVTGFATDRAYTVAAFDDDCAAVGLVREHRFATWDLRAWPGDGGWAVTVCRTPAP